jgi:hypothetical protein
MKIASVKPAPGILVFRQPENDYKPMPLDGAIVEMTPYYIRAIREGDLVFVPAAAPELPPAAPTTLDTSEG